MRIQCAFQKHAPHSDKSIMMRAFGGCLAHEIQLQLLSLHGSACGLLWLMEHVEVI